MVRRPLINILGGTLTRWLLWLLLGVLHVCGVLGVRRHAVGCLRGYVLLWLCCCMSALVLLVAVWWCVLFENCIVDASIDAMPARFFVWVLCLCFCNFVSV